ncbi:MAG: diadenylate cyclase CdaA [Deltaproteobacteria bacterium]|nr:diadenylate cyclase CdaA [Deltaproteobacteria bacterium]
MLELLPDLRPLDVVDILVVAFLFYRVLLIIKGTRAIQVLIGLVALIGLYLMSQLLRLQTVGWLLDEFSLYLVLAVIILFQEDIRRGLARVGGPWLGRAPSDSREGLYQQVARACFRLADQGKGALIVVERAANLDELEDDATVLNASLSEELLVAIFQPTSPIHDGAVVVREGGIWVAGAFLPLTRRTDIDRSLGTRHRAAMGLTEETDSLIFCVSEERRRVSIAFKGDLHIVDTPDELRLEVQRLLQLEAEEAEESRGLTLTGTSRPVKRNGAASSGSTETIADKDGHA